MCKELLFGCSYMLHIFIGLTVDCPQAFKRMLVWWMSESLKKDNWHLTVLIRYIMH